MTTLSTRYLVPLLLMLLATAVPVTAHYVVGLPNEDCADPDGLKQLAILGAEDVVEGTRHYNYAISQLTRGKINGARFVWVRSSVPQPFYGERPFYTPGVFTETSPQLERVRVDGVEVPIRVWQQPVLSNTETTAILTVYRGRPVENVFASSWDHAVDTMFNGPRIVNFIGITGIRHTAQAPAARDEVLKWITTSWTHYLRTCEPQ